LSVEDAAQAEVPLMFVSFPSAKDPSWSERYPGMYTFTHSPQPRILPGRRDIQVCTHSHIPLSQGSFLVREISRYVHIYTFTSAKDPSLSERYPGMYTFTHFPSAKDPSLSERYPGMYTFTHSPLPMILPGQRDIQESTHSHMYSTC
jgi:hypothetical protein